MKKAKGGAGKKSAKLKVAHQVRGLLLFVGVQVLGSGFQANRKRGTPESSEDDD